MPLTKQRASPKNSTGGIIFLSHAAADRDAALELAAQLRKQGLAPWLAEESVPTGGNWLLESGEALRKADGMVVLVSPDAMKSEFVQREVEYALSAPRFKDRLVAVEVKATSRTPWILKRLDWIAAPRSLPAASRDIARIFARRDARPAGIFSQRKTARAAQSRVERAKPE